MREPKVVYCDNHVLVVDKPHGMATQPGLTEWAKNWIKYRFGKPGAVFLQPIHQLDQPVAGLVIFARTSKALSRLSASMRERRIRKQYRAEVDTAPQLTEATLEHYLVHDDHFARVVPPSDPQGKKAVLHYKLVEERTLEIDLITGRYHQIRVQLAAIGSPIKGDVKYGSKSPRSEIALIHERCTFPHPVQPIELSLTTATHHPSAG